METNLINKFIMLDTSVLAKLLSSGKYRKLEDREFIRKWGLPFITLYHIQELAGVDSYSQFKNRAIRIGSLNSLFTLSSDDAVLPGTILDLIKYEIEATHKIRSIDDRIDFVKSKITSYKFLTENKLLELIYEQAKIERSSYSFLSLSGVALYNPYEEKPLKEIIDKAIRLDDIEVVNAIAERFATVVKNRTSLEESTSREMFLKTYHEVRGLKGKYETVIEYITHSVDEDIDLNRSLKYYTMLAKFTEIKRIHQEYFLSKGINVDRITMNDSPSFLLQEDLRTRFNEMMRKDTKRKIELSNQIDIMLSVFAFYILTIVDKRTAAFLDQIKIRELHYKKVNYNDFL